MTKEVARDAFNLAMQIFKHANLQKWPSGYNIRAHPPKHVINKKMKKRKKERKEAVLPRIFVDHNPSQLG